MATTINADTVTGGAIITGDTSGILGLQAAGSTLVTLNSGVVAVAGSLTVTGDPTFSSSGAAKLPGGTTAQRPGSPTNGMIRYNADDGSFEGYAAGEWGAIGGGGDVQTATTNNVTQTVLASYAVADYGAIKAIITAWDSARPSRMATELLITHDGSSTAVATQYATIASNDSDLATYDVDISGGNVRILGTATDSAARSYVVLGSLVQV